MNYKAEFIVGKQSPSQWSGVYGYVPEEERVLQERGSVYAVISLQSDSKSDSLERIATLSLDELQRFLYEEEIVESYLDHVENAMSSLKARLEEIVSRENTLAEGLEFEIALSIVFEGYAYFAVVGDASIHLYRNFKSIDISNVLIDTKMDGYLKSGSMLLEDSDKMILLTSKMIKEGVGIITNILESLKLTKLTSDFIHKPGIAALVLASEADWEQMQEEEHSEKEKSSDKIVSAAFSNAAEGDFAEENEALGITTSSEDNKQEEAQFDDESSQNDDITDKEFEENNDKKFTDRLPRVELSSVSEKLKNLQHTVAGAAAHSGKSIKSFWQERVIGHFQNNKRTYAQVVRRVFGGTANIFKKGYEIFKREVLGTGSYDRRNIYDRTKRIKRNRRIFAFAVVIVIIGGYFFITSTMRANQRAADRKEAEESLTSLRSDYDTIAAEVLAARSLGVDKKQEVLNEIDSFISDVNSQSSDEYFTEDFEELANLASFQKDELLLIEKVAQPQVIVDFGSLFESVNLTDLEYTNGSIFVSDAERNVVYKAGVSLQVNPQEHISNVIEPEFLIANSTGDVIVYDNDTTSSIGRFSSTESDSLTRFNGLFTPQDIGSVAEVGLFTNTNGLYELKVSNQQIYRRDVNGDSYLGGGALYTTSNPPNWKTDAELGRAIDIAVPFEIYVLIENGGIRRYLGGGDNTLTFELFTGLLAEDFAAFNDATSFDVADNYMAVSDPQRNRIMLFQIADTDEKEMTLLKQFVIDAEGDYFSNLQELVINEEARKIYVLDGSRVLRLDF